MNQSQEFALIFKKAITDPEYIDDVTNFLSKHTVRMDHDAFDASETLRTTVTFHDRSVGTITGQYWANSMEYHPSTAPVRTQGGDAESNSFMNHMKNLQRRAIQASTERQENRTRLLSRV